MKDNPSIRILLLNKEMSGEITLPTILYKDKVNLITNNPAE